MAKFPFVCAHYWLLTAAVSFVVPFHEMVSCQPLVGVLTKTYTQDIRKTHLTCSTQYLLLGNKTVFGLHHY